MWLLSRQWLHIDWSGHELSACIGWLLHNSDMRASIDDVNLLVNHWINIYSNQKALVVGLGVKPVKTLSFKLLERPYFLSQQHLAYSPSYMPINYIWLLCKCGCVLIIRYLWANVGEFTTFLGRLLLLMDP